MLLSKEQALGLWQKYSGTILSRPERLAFYENCKPLLHFDEDTLRTALNFCKKEGDFSIKRIAQLATAVRRGTVPKILRRSDKDKLIERIIFERTQLVSLSHLERRFREKTEGSKIELAYTDVERAWRIAALTLLAEGDERLISDLNPREKKASPLERIFSLKIFDGDL
ncbi:MAG: hypothetical protein M1548_06530 [Actinobacteria bacterium]|nr:hypothetical protein [Actinomycetota bacterium]